MHSIVAGGREPLISVGLSSQPHVRINGTPVRIGRVPLADVEFHPEQPHHRRHVLVDVEAFSCNYRDRAILLRCGGLPNGRHSAFGSELTGRVRAVGADVTELSVGDRVIPDNHFVGDLFPAGAESRGGIATNQASRRSQILHATKLVRIPESMDAEVAAAFGINAQTAYSMVRRLGLAPQSTVLVTAGTSNTSLFAIGAARAAGARVFAVTGSAHRESALRAAGAEDVVIVPHAKSGIDRTDMLRHAGRAVGGFDAVIDPFFDLHLPDILGALRPFGSYISCGLFAQNEGAEEEAGLRRERDCLSSVMLEVMPRNLSIIGNCIGLRSDLQRAIDDYSAGVLPVRIDSVFRDDGAAFVDRTFNDTDRVGKVIWRYR
jgi:NADPH:quinone reductase-like Zn-dependent oxidoreductase